MLPLWDVIAFILTIVAELPNPDRSPPRKDDNLVAFPIPPPSRLEMSSAMSRKKSSSSFKKLYESSSSSSMDPPLCSSSTRAFQTQNDDNAIDFSSPSPSTPPPHLFAYLHPHSFDIRHFSSSHRTGCNYLHNTHFERCSFPRPFALDLPRAALSSIHYDSGSFHWRLDKTTGGNTTEAYID